MRRYPLQAHTLPGLKCYIVACKAYILNATTLKCMLKYTDIWKKKTFNYVQMVDLMGAFGRSEMLIIHLE